MCNIHIKSLDLFVKMDQAKEAGGVSWVVVVVGGGVVVKDCCKDRVFEARLGKLE